MVALHTDDGSDNFLRELGQQLRVDSIRCTTAAGSGHPTSSLSAADLTAVLLARFLRWDIARPDRADNDHLIFSKGHASPLLYSLLKAAGALSDEELLTFRRFGSRVAGHPVPTTLPGVEVATGSLGQGLPIGVGIALAGKYLDKLPYRVWVLLGDSEMSEGSVWEAFDHARHYALTNLIAILDMNRLGQRGPTPLGWNSEAYAARARAFGWGAMEVDGHDVRAIASAYEQAASAGSPTLVIARTIKGKGVSFLEDRENWHGKILSEEQARGAIAELGGPRELRVSAHLPDDRAPAAPAGEPLPAALPTYRLAEEIATRKAYGDALAAIGARGDIVAMDAEVSNSTYTEEFARAHPGRFFEMFIAEQQMVAAAVGMSVRKRRPFASTFAAFLSRAYDFIRMAAVSRANVCLCGSHAGVSIGEDGPSQMGLEDLAMMRAVHGSTVLYPCCANQTVRLVEAMADRDGIVYLRTTRMKTPVLYDGAELFPIGGSKVLRRSATDRATIVAAGITVHEALGAASNLDAEGIAVRVFDAYSVKPLDEEAIRTAARETDGNVVVVEDHWAEGGLGDAVLECLSRDLSRRPRVIRLAVRAMPLSGNPRELLRAAGIDAEAITKAVKELVESSGAQGSRQRHPPEAGASRPPLAAP